MPRIWHRLAKFYPPVFLLVLAAGLLALTGWTRILATTLWVYLVPPLTARVVQFFWPLEDGWSEIGPKARRRSPWWVLHFIQTPYLAIPVFERVLRFIPGAYSAWLRLWGSQIGHSVYWTPRVEVIDRTSLVIGDRVVLGDKCYLSAHVIRRKNDRVILLHSRVTVEDDCLIGMCCVLSAGSRLERGKQLDAGERLYPMGREAHELTASSSFAL